MMDGELGVDSAPGRGSRFHFSANFGLGLERAADDAASSDGGLHGARVHHHDAVSSYGQSDVASGPAK